MKKLIYLLTCFLMGLPFILQAQETAPDFVWGISAGGGGVEDSFRMDTDQNGNIYSVGFFSETSTFGNFILTTEEFSGEMFVTKTDPSGQYSWALHLEVLPYYFGADDNTHEFRGAISVDADGYSYIMGNLKETATIGDTILTSSGGFDFFMLKLDPSGEILWVNQIGGVNDEMGFSMKYFDDDNIYITGVLSGPFSLGDFTLSGNGNKNIFIAKMDSDGNFIWAKEVGSSTQITPRKLETDYDGNLYLAGTYRGVIELGDITLSSNANSVEVFVTKLNSEGDFLMGKRAGGTTLYTPDYAFDMVLDSQGSVFLGGRFTGQLLFDEIELNSLNGVENGFVSKLNGEGNFVWAKQIVHTREHYFRSRPLNLAVDSYDNIYLNENFHGTVTIDDYSLTYHPEEAQMIYVLKMDGEGNNKWIKPGGYIGNTRSPLLSIDKNDNIILSGEFAGSPVYDDITLENQGYSDIFIVRLSEQPAGGFNRVSTITEFSEYGRTFGDGNYDNESLVSVLAVPEQGYDFSHWEENGQIVSDEERYSFILTDNKYLKAVFSPLMDSKDWVVEEFNLYPNPTKDRLNIEYSKVIDELSIIGMDGREVVKTELNFNKTQLDVSQLPAGVYIVKIRSGKTVKTQKLIKK